MNNKQTNNYKLIKLINLKKKRERKKKRAENQRQKKIS
jgi:hypothetical protein